MTSKSYDSVSDIAMGSLFHFEGVALFNMTCFFGCEEFTNIYSIIVIFSFLLFNFFLLKMLQFSMEVIMQEVEFLSTTNP